jgi:hypothetical protein
MRIGNGQELAMARRDPYCGPGAASWATGADEDERDLSKRPDFEAWSRDYIAWYRSNPRQLTMKEDRIYRKVLELRAALGFEDVD